MPLTCLCDDWNVEYWFEPDSDFRTLETKRSRRCESCKTLICPGDVCLSFYCWRSPRDDIEERIHGDEVPMATRYYCEKCGELFFNFDELGYCIRLGENMFELLNEYKELHR